MKITITQARRVLEIVDAGLVCGQGIPEPGKMCVEAAVCYALGQPFGDEPKCVHPVVRCFKIALNDKSWSSNQARAKGMRRIAIAQLGSIDAGFDSVKFLAILSELTIRRIVPMALRSAASVKGNESHRETMEDAAARCEMEGTRESALAARKSADAAAAAAYAYADADAAAAAAYAADYAYAAAYAAAYADAAAYAAAYADADAKDKYLTICAEIGVDALRAAGSHGIKLMDELGI